MRFLLLLPLVFLFAFTSCNRAHKQKIALYKSQYKYVSDVDWDIIKLPQSYIENNVYGKEYLRNNIQIIFSDSLGENFGWYWEYAYTTKDQSALPQNIIGKKPWLDLNSNKKLPARIDSIESIAFNFKYNVKATGNLENSITIYITNSKDSKPEDIICRIFCIFGNMGTDYQGNFIKTDTLDNLILDEYYYYEKGGPYNLAFFYLKNTNNNLVINLEKFVQYLLIKQYYKSTDYVSGIEMATSIKWGKGECVFNDFSYTINLK